MPLPYVLSWSELGKSAISRTRALLVLEFFHRRAGAEEISVAINVVDAGDSRPEFVFACPRGGESCLFARVRVVPFVRGDFARSVRRVLEQVILLILFSVSDCFHFRVDGNHRLAKPIKLVFRFALGRLDHHRPAYWPRDGRRMKAVIHQTFCHVSNFNAGAFPLAQIDNAFVRDQAMLPFE